MSEPITLFDPDGREVVVHGRGQADVMVAQQGYTWTRPESGAGGAVVDGPPATPGPEDAPPPARPAPQGGA